MVLNPQTGATRTIVRDFNQDGRLDIASLFAQGDERVILYVNEGNLTFKERVLQRFPSIYGTSSFDLVDMDADGDLDLVSTAGDNADFSTVLNPTTGFISIKIQEISPLNRGNFSHKMVRLRRLLPILMATEIKILHRLPFFQMWPNGLWKVLCTSKTKEKPFSKKQCRSII